MEKQTFHAVTRKIFFISQIFGLFPVSNLLRKDINKLRYSWISIPTLYTSVIMVLNLMEFSLVIYQISKSGLNFHNSGTVSLFVVCLLEHYYFWRLATKWPKLMQQWHEVETIFLRAPYQLYCNVNKKFRIYFWYSTIMLTAWAEHLLLLYNSFHNSALEIKQCNLNTSFWESLYRRERSYLPPVIPFHYVLLPILEWLNLTLAYPRSFTDVFIMIICIGICLRFRQLYLRIDSIRAKSMPSIFWTETREHYLVLKKLMRIINKEISMLILLSSSNNFYFICFQLFNSFSNIDADTVAAVAFWFSLSFNIFRTILTLYIASQINDYTRKMVSCLRDVSSKSWCMETQRFSEQLSVDLTAFTANGFYFMTRKLILAMASTIVTYELLVMDVINQGSIKQITDYCAHYYEEPADEYNMENND